MDRRKSANTPPSRKDGSRARYNQKRRARRCAFTTLKVGQNKGGALNKAWACIREVHRGCTPHTRERRAEDPWRRKTDITRLAQAFLSRQSSLKCPDCNKLGMLVEHGDLELPLKQAVKCNGCKHQITSRRITALLEEQLGPLLKTLNGWDMDRAGSKNWDDNLEKTRVVLHDAVAEKTTITKGEEMIIIPVRMGTNAGLNRDSEN